jgi:thiamine-phosphate pyrophosphorylase
MEVSRFQLYHRKEAAAILEVRRCGFIVMQPLFTPGAERAMQLAGALARQSNASRVEPAHLLWALVLDESRGAEILAAHEISREMLRDRLPLAAGDIAVEPAPADDLGEPNNNEVEAVLIEARRQAALLGKHAEIGSEHLLCGLAAVPSAVQELLAAHGLGAEVAVERSIEHGGGSADPLPVEIHLAPAADSAADATDTQRILDAAANRAREGLRVLEDYVRFSLDDRHLTRLLKNWRHRLAAILSTFDSQGLVSSRDTPRDVGTTIKTRREGVRETLRDVVTANFKRAQEATRTLEEYGKLLASALGRQFEELRYDLYTIEKGVLITSASRERLADRSLYVLVSSELCPHGSGPVIAAALAGGAGVIQVREKKMSDRELMAYGKLVREWTARAEALFVMNDRPDLAVLTSADGVHVGQEELSVREARRIVGPSRLVGVSTHTLEQARQAVLDGADYIGVGPVFSSTTKSFSHLAGLELVRQVAAEITLPVYAIGGIGIENLDEVLSAGARRIAVSGAICGAEDPANVARLLRAKLAGAPVLNTDDSS